MSPEPILAEQLTDPIAYHGEGPVWSAGWGGLRWVDMLAGDVLSLAGDRTVGRLHVGAVAAVIRPRAGGGAIIGVERGFAMLDADGSLTTMPPLWDDPTIRMNEGGCDPYGRFYCGSMAYDQRPGAGALYRLDPDGSVDVVLAGVTISNGLDWSPDGARAYYNDTTSQRVDVFDDDGESGLSRRRPFVEIPDGDGHPDGLTVDEDGGVWVALYGGRAVRHYSCDGVLADVVEVPADKVTACTFGGAELDQLFITTSREGLAVGDDRLAGSVFVARVGTRGVPVREFAG